MTKPQIRELLNDMAAGHRAKDAAQIVAGYAPDIVLYSLAPPLLSHCGDLLDIGGGRKVDMTTAEGVQRWARRARPASGSESRSADARLRAGGRSPTSTSPCRSTWT